MARREARRAVTTSAVAQLEEGVGQSLRSAPIPVLTTALRGYGADFRGQLLQELEQVVFLKRTELREDSRVAIARSLVALLPASLGTIAEVLKSRGDAGAYELHFSLFCFLSDHPQVQADQRLRHQLLHHIERYLESVRAATGEAAWMAGDLLGDHWPLEEALPVLLSLARSARYVAGREGALHGLAHALARATKQGQWEIMAGLKAVAAGDRSEAVRSYATQIMSTLRGV